jgi:catechol 2,3-dioxygenase-like lactoylglutathione lyase family enzyme
MNPNAEAIVREYESGRLSRRQLVARLMALGVASLGAQSFATAQDAATRTAGTFAASGIDHLALAVTDIGRSAAFYQKHLSLRLARGGAAGDGSAFLNTSGGDFLALFRADQPGLHHFSFSIPDYDPDDAARRIGAAGLKPRREGNRVYFRDPDGLTVQVHPGRGMMRGA